MLPAFPFAVADSSSPVAAAIYDDDHDAEGGLVAELGATQDGKGYVGMISRAVPMLHRRSTTQHVSHQQQLE